MMNWRVIKKAGGIFGAGDCLLLLPNWCGLVLMSSNAKLVPQLHENPAFQT